MIFEIILAVVVPLLPVPQVEEVPPFQIVYADYVVINTVVTFDEEEPDVWGRPVYKRNEAVWISFWVKERAFFFPVLINRGWFHDNQMESIVRCSEGLMVNLRCNISVVIREIRFIRSKEDYEMKMRLSGKCLFMPMVKQ